MTKPVKPVDSKVYGAERWLWVFAIADIFNTKLAEVTAASAYDISLVLFDSSADPTKSVNTVTKPKRKCDTATYQQIGDTSYTGGDLRAQLAPQGAPLSAGRKAFETLNKASGFLVRRMSVDLATDFSIADYVDVFPSQISSLMPTKEGDGEAAVAAALGTFVVTDEPAFLVKLS